MFAPDCLLALHSFQLLAGGHPLAARNLANLILLLPGYIVELGFYLVVFLAYLVPAWRNRKPLTAAHRSLLFIAAVTLLIVSVLRSSVLTSNDFGWRGALLLQFALLLMAADLLVVWNWKDHPLGKLADCCGLPQSAPQWFRSIASLALAIGVAGTICQVLFLRFDYPLAGAMMSASHDPNAGKFFHQAYFSSIGYTHLDAAISHDAVVQYNPDAQRGLELMLDLIGVNHQSAIASDHLWCGSELGGDPSGCPAMAAAIDALYKSATAEQARATCRRYGIGYLVANINDSVWNNRNGWVWTLQPAVADEEFRALDCR
jgi:hypothetical protein